MTLSEYAKKRRFTRTPEPKGRSAKGQGPLRFVVQKHFASSLHYDFRLEFDGTLKSWAVPKGPSLRPHDKHLAMKVEDHPLEYSDFEGVIPEGNYGAGSVMVWDAGNYFSRHAADRRGSEKEMRSGLKKGHLVFILNGQKLKGEFALIKMQDAKDENAWLLIKKGDQYARDSDITKKAKSVKSGRSIEQIAKEDDPLNLDQAPKSKMPHDTKPMLSTLTADAFDDHDWLFEIKWDGYRAIAEREDGKVRLYSRNLQPFNPKFPGVVSALEELDHDFVLDGEVVALDKEGKPSFQLLQDYTKTPAGSIVFCIFDILHLDGRDLTSLPLWKRKVILQHLLPQKGPLKFSEHVAGNGRSFFAAAEEQGLEGIMAKRKDSSYRIGKRGRDWLKIKAVKRQEAVIGGFTETRGGRQHFGALILGVFEKGKLSYIGHVGSGFDEQSLKALHQKLLQLKRPASPFTPNVKGNMPTTWVEPELVCEVKFSEWTKDGQMRQPIFLGLRPDKKPKQVVKELPRGTR